MSCPSAKARVEIYPPQARQQTVDAVKNRLRNRRGTGRQRPLADRSQGSAISDLVIPRRQRSRMSFASGTVSTSRSHSPIQLTNTPHGLCVTLASQFLAAEGPSARDPGLKWRRRELETGNIQ